MTQLRLAPSGPALRLAPTELRLLPWRDNWDTSGQGSLSATEWTDGGYLGGMDLGDGTVVGSRLWLNARIPMFSAGGAFPLDFGKLDTIDSGVGTLRTTTWEYLDSRGFVVRGAYLLTAAGVQIATLSPVAPVDLEGRYWSLPMPSRASVGLAAGAYALVQLRFQPQLRKESSQAYYWQQDLPADTPEPQGHTFGEMRAAWQVRYAAELAWNAAAKIVNLFFLVSAPGA